MTVRHAVDADCHDLFLWRNDPVTRANSFNQDAIDYAHHQKWFRGALAKSSWVILIGEKGGESVGMVCYKTLADAVDSATVSINLNPHCRGQGLGKWLLREADACFADGFRRESTEKDTLANGKIIAEVKVANTPSIRLFTNANYEVKNTDEITGVITFEKGFVIYEK